MMKKQYYAILLLTLVVLVGCDVSGDGASTAPASPSLKTLPITNISQTTASSGGYITSDGGKMLIEKGIAWDTLPNPTIFTTRIKQEGDTEQYTSGMTDLLPSKVYYVRAYAINEIGVSYGNQLTFTTLAVPIVYEIGDIGPGGGYVFQLEAGGIHGKEIAPLSTQFQSQWGCPNASITGTLATEGSGQANSDLIIAYHEEINYYADPSQCTQTITATGDVAAKNCSDLVFNGFNDWYLPSIGDLELVYTNLILESFGDITDLSLSSSTEAPTDANSVMVLQTDNGTTAPLSKGNSTHHRAVRNF
jgi:hypothetical protein